MLVTQLPMVTEVKSLHPKNVPSPMLITLEGISTKVKPLPENAYIPMLVTLLGIVMEVKPIQFRNAD